MQLSLIYLGISQLIRKLQRRMLHMIAQRFRQILAPRQQGQQPKDSHRKAWLSL